MYDYSSLLADVKANVSAYQKILASAPTGELPLLTKENYLLAFPMEELCRPGDMDAIHLIGGSSGYSGGRKVYWPKRPTDEAGYMQSIETMLCRNYHLTEHRTLVVECLALGLWMGGMQIAAALRGIALSGRYSLTIATPGLDLRGAIDIIKSYGERYSQILIITNPSNISLIAALMQKAGVATATGRVRFPVVGEYFTETFREHVAAQFGHDADDPFVVWTGYGSADVGDVGAETVSTIALRKYLHRHAAVATEIFGTTSVPMILALSPSVFVEVVDGNLVITKDQLIPLIRYNTKDAGGVLRRTELVGRVPEELLSALPEEMVYVHGRVSDAVVFYGTNLSTTAIGEYLLSLPATLGYGGLFTVHLSTHDGITRLEFVVYVRPEVCDMSQAAAKAWEQRLVDFLCNRSDEFAHKYRQLSASVDEALISVELADVATLDARTKHRYIV